MLIIALVVLVFLGTTIYLLTTQLLSFKSRRQYMIDYQVARYACDSAMKYALATIEEIDLNLVSRKDQPDFSDVFAMTEDEYNRFLEYWAERINEIREEKYEQRKEKMAEAGDMIMSDLFGEGYSAPEPNEPNAVGYDFLYGSSPEMLDANDVIIPGPYGPPWPYVQKPIEIDIDQSQVTIEIMDENAKLPLIWAATEDEEINREAEAAVETFCEWMSMDFEDIDYLLEQVVQLGEYKRFQLNAGPVKIEKKQDPKSSKDDRRASSSRRRRTSRTRTEVETRKAVEHSTDFAKLLHSSVINTELLSRPLPETGPRAETPVKYLALWGSQRVNINTAPRHVLEAALMFGGNASQIADEIIKLRQEKPFQSQEDIEERLYHQVNYIKKSESFITTESQYLAIRITARSGSATVVAVATVIKDGNRAEPVAVMMY